MGTFSHTLHLDRAGLQLGLEHRPEDGLVLSDSPGLEPLVWLVNRLATGDVQPVPDDVVLEDESLRELGSLAEPLDGGSLRIFSPESTLEVERDVLYECLDALMEQRLAEPFWLFRPDPTFWRPSRADRELAVQLEPEARRLDETAVEDARAHARRRLLLAQLQTAGILEPKHARWRLRWLEALGCEVLLTYQHAAVDLAEYRSSGARQRVFEAIAQPVPDEPHVSLDWFRPASGRAPEAKQSSWSATCETAVIAHADVGSYSGEVFFEAGGEVYVLRWRRDDGITPALVSAHPLDRSR
jgi:hypothetical protein